MTGRPSTYSLETATLLCELIPMWDKSLDKLCKSDDRLPDSAYAIYSWLAKHEEFAAMYARAKSAQAERLAEEMLDIADDDSRDFVERTRKDGSKYMAVDNEAIGRSRLRVDTRKWLLAKLRPRTYGEKLDITSNSEHVAGKALTATEREARAASIAAAAALRKKGVDNDPFS